jgi:death-on-curing protein
MQQVDIADYLVIAEAVTGMDAHALKGATRIGVAESALAAPFAAFGGVEFYPELQTKAGVLFSRLIRNHPMLVDGNKRTAFVTTNEFLVRNGARWVDRESAADRARTIESFAAGEIDEETFVSWVAEHVETP